MTILTAIVSVIVVVILVLMYLDNRKTTSQTMTLLAAMMQKPPPPVLAPVPYMTYAEAIKAMDRMVVVTFQRIYVNEVLPSIMNADGEVSMLAPTDIKYEEFITSGTLQVFENIPHYLRKSIYYYFDVKPVPGAALSADPGIATLTRYVAAKVKGLLDSQLISNIEKIEKNGPNAGVYKRKLREFGSFDFDEFAKRKNNPLSEIPQILD